MEGERDEADRIVAVTMPLSYHPLVIALRARTAATIEKQPVTVHREQEFVFTQEGRPTEGALDRCDLLLALPAVSDDVVEGHLARGDFRRWIEGRLWRQRARPERRDVSNGEALGASSPSATVGGRHESA